MTETTSQFAERRSFSLLEICLTNPRLDLPTATALAASVVAIALGLFHVFVAAFGTPESLSFRSTHLSAMLLLAVALKPLFRGGIREPVYVDFFNKAPRKGKCRLSACVRTRKSLRFNICQKHRREL